MSLAPVIREGRIYTRDLKGGRPVYGEQIVEIDGDLFREWIPWRSKMAALLKKDHDISIPSGRVLYLGAAQGTTVSHISDLNPSGIIFAVEFSRVPFVKLSALARERGNIVPILEDAGHPERYAAMVGSVDFIYQDVSQKDQAGIFLRNADTLLRKGGSGILMIKARSIDVTSDPAGIYEMISDRISDAGYTVARIQPLDPYQADHAAIICIRS
ncbi:MAG: fibrillarin-like rRNA/tRNA 2'-O-methyltransferase [Thermoplasmatota archaeon]